MEVTNLNAWLLDISGFIGRFLRKSDYIASTSVGFLFVCLFCVTDWVVNSSMFTSSLSSMRLFSCFQTFTKEILQSFKFKLFGECHCVILAGFGIFPKMEDWFFFSCNFCLPGLCPFVSCCLLQLQANPWGSKIHFGITSTAKSVLFVYLSRKMNESNTDIWSVNIAIVEQKRHHTSKAAQNTRSDNHTKNRQKNL